VKLSGVLDVERHGTSNAVMTDYHCLAHRLSALREHASLVAPKASKSMRRPLPISSVACRRPTR